MKGLMYQQSTSLSKDKRVKEKLYVIIFAVFYSAKADWS